MGYTHYLRRVGIEVDPETWNVFIQKVNKIIALFNVPLAGGFGEGSPKIDDEKVWLNGRGRYSYETLYITRKITDRQKKRHDAIQSAIAQIDAVDENETDFMFCKTGRMPYDSVVLATYVVASTLFGWEVSSDGGECAINDMKNTLIEKHILTKDTNRVYAHA